MRILLVNPRFPDSYWSGRSSLDFVGRPQLHPPLGLVTVAALLPQSWSFRLVDLNVREVSDDELIWADAVMLTGWLVQHESLHGMLERCQRLGVRTVVGGPYATALPGDFEKADHVVVGEAELIVPELATDLELGRAQHLYRETAKPELSESPIPRFDLLDPAHYYHMCIQYSRGCPFTCEFCDIIVMYGRRPRAKTPAQVIAELDAIRATGFEGDIYFVDDNFIGNKKEVEGALEEIVAWRERVHPPFEFYTTASLDLAASDRLVRLMTRAGFTAVFIGIETPSAESLRETKKLQNLRGDMVDQIHSLLERGLDIWGGFILGFDNDGPDIFDRMIDFIEASAIPYAMVGVLGALPNTPLHHRLEEEGRLRDGWWGDQLGLTNVMTRIPTPELLDGYRRVQETLFEPDAYFDRCRAHLSRWNPVPGSRRPIRSSDVRAALRGLVTQGIREPYRGAYWRFLLWVARNHPSKLPKAVIQAAAGHHFLRYTRETVIPGLRASAAALARSEEAA